MNYRFIAAMLVSSFMLAPLATAAPPDPTADYDLAIGLTDSRGNGAALTTVGTEPTSNVNVQVNGATRQALAVPRGAGLRLEAGPLLPQDTYSMAMWVQLQSTSSYAKLIDTNNLAADSGLYAQGTDLRYYTAGSTDTSSFTAGVFHHVVITRAANGVYSGYLNGVPQFTFTDTGAQQLTAISAERVLHFLRDDNSTSNVEESDAVLLRIRLYDTVLSPADVRAIDPTFVFADSFEASR